MSYPLGDPKRGYTPKEVYDFWLQLLNGLLFRPPYLWRVISKTSIEVGLIIAYKGYRMRVKKNKKLSTSLIPGCYVVGSAPEMSTCLKFRVESDIPRYEVMAVSYTHDAMIMSDAITMDDIFPQELEVGIYGDYLPVYPLVINDVRLNNVVDAYLNPEANYDVADKIAHECFCDYLGVARKYYTYDRLVGDFLYAKYLTLVTVADSESYGSTRITYDFAEVWDWFWSLGPGERYYPLNAPPDFHGKALRTEDQKVLVLDENQYMCKCRYVASELHIPGNDCNELCRMSYEYYLELLNYYRKNKVPEKRYKIYQPFVKPMREKPVPDTPLGRRAERIYRMYPQYFDSPREVYLMLRWNIAYNLLPDEDVAKDLIKLKKSRMNLR